MLEIDGASNNGVEQVRELRETVKYAPSSSKFKIYIIDEVHMLSTAAFNALLKTLEEPPAHVEIHVCYDRGRKKYCRRFFRAASWFTMPAADSVGAHYKASGAHCRSWRR